MTSTAELLQAEAELWCHAFGYLKSMALQCAIKLGIPNAIHRCGGTVSLPELHAALPVAASKRPCVSRIMTFLAASGIFVAEDCPADAEVTAGVRYSLTPASRLLVDDDDNSVSSHHPPCLSRFLLLCCSPLNFRASQSLADWLRDEGDDAAAAAETPFMMANGASLYGLASRDAEFGARFSEGMGSDSRFMAEILARGGCAPVFAGLTSLVDVGGGDGTTARAIARAYPHVRCSVLELPQVVDAVPADGGAVEFVAGDMMEYIPPSDAVLLKV
jgi:hypothetical protein